MAVKRREPVQRMGPAAQAKILGNWAELDRELKRFRVRPEKRRAILTRVKKKTISPTELSFRTGSLQSGTTAKTVRNRGQRFLSYILFRESPLWRKRLEERTKVEVQRFEEQAKMPLSKEEYAQKVKEIRRRTGLAERRQRIYGSKIGVNELPPKIQKELIDGRNFILEKVLRHLPPARRARALKKIKERKIGEMSIADAFYREEAGKELREVVDYYNHFLKKKRLHKAMNVKPRNRVSYLKQLLFNKNFVTKMVVHETAHAIEEETGRFVSVPFGEAFQRAYLIDRGLVPREKLYTGITQKELNWKRSNEIEEPDISYKIGRKIGDWAHRKYGGKKYDYLYLRALGYTHETAGSIIERGRFLKTIRGYSEKKITPSIAALE
ncbi:MAG: hypothetical protein NTZ73_02515 [Candidatus Diapherotrites archaeon]|nr:hypothetical protein [Candidatus Diapherotrites archaeon]